MSLKVILYIGHHKVGSTALQVYLAQNWLRLARAGILYPSVESLGFASNIGCGVAGQDGREAPSVQVREPHSALAYRMLADADGRKIPPQFRTLPGTGQMLLAIRNQVAQLRPDCVVLCSEAFSNFGQVDPGQIDRLCKIFPKARFVIYCVLRRPDDYLVSWHGQRLKVGESPRALSDGALEDYLPGIHFDFRQVVRPWAERVPNAQLILRAYSGVLAAGGSTEDFALQSGIDLPKGMRRAPHANPSLPRASHPILERANAEAAPAIAQQLRRHLMQQRKTVSPVPNEDVEFFGARRRRDLFKRFAPIHADLCALSGRRPFFPDLEDMRRPRPVPAHTAAQRLLEALDPAALPTPELRDYIVQLKADF